ncbi:MAG: hypothetical protein OEZ43_01780 [Gammaproteobacteria bacterium]|nr:hypothetical protein [Gammaproteobacteria bacterium]
MFTVETVVVSALLYVLMLVAFRFPHIRLFHIGTMSSVMLFDLLMPFYLYLNRDWKERLIDGGEIFSFLIWMHFGVVLTLYALYIMQIIEGRKILRGKNKVRESHRNLGKGILLVRFIVVFSGALLYEPEQTPQV